MPVGAQRFGETKVTPFQEFIILAKGRLRRSKIQNTRSIRTTLQCREAPIQHQLQFFRWDLRDPPINMGCHKLSQTMWEARPPFLHQVFCDKRGHCQQPW
jgi:hypothetical protein